MNIQKYIIPMFVGSNLLGQTVNDGLQDMSFGFSHSIFTSICFQSMPKNLLSNKDVESKKNPITISETQLGFGIGFFLYLPLNEMFFFKPKIEGFFSNISIYDSPVIHAKSLDLSFSPAFCFALKPIDNHGIIYLARNMSCYLTGKQPYVFFSPLINLKKIDEDFLIKGFQNEIAIGAFVGYGISYEFHGINFAPEISYSITNTSQNKVNSNNKILHTITLSVNLY